MFGSWLAGFYSILFISVLLLSPAGRRRELARAKEVLADESEARAQIPGKQDLLSKIQDFFKL
ncbi:MAG: hypothetical protein COX65_05985 [Elusimicrobia bacterium CG_4_10_14_0_2_um_filter_56_8]|nr:MAG: hypothetical protein COX65_05985 [Elusimicrobia bacterium CG_4_10_14_0_2_um_filter_56_8]